MNRTGRIYLGTIVGLGFLVILESLIRLHQAPLGSQGLQWVLLAVLTLISGSASIELPRANVSISISEAFVFTAVLLYGPAAGTLTVALDGLVISFWVARRRPELHRALFNIAAPALSAWCSSHLFFYASGIAPLAIQPATLNEILPALVLFAVVYFGLNSWLIAFVIAFQRRTNPLDVWRSGFLWLSLNYFCGASLAVLLVGYNRTIDVRFVGVVVPLLLVLYFTFKTSMQRVEDANKHVEALNTLYLSTIETLAMAIDAKDQVTHGHIRRVQSYATSLAREIGIKDVKLIKAVEAAALLHDMGKLAVPEYILNKPGKLTESEFEKMKLHASVGADILSAIAFPYPVVPIVRHHHENWDGTGYPAGLRGTDIPIGARILSVVDCFDALTSDRPYRPKLSDEEALRILNERRGTMYDPLIVDTFARVYASIAPPQAAERPRAILGEIAGLKNGTTSENSPVLGEIVASADEMLTLYEMARALAGETSMSDAADKIAVHLRRLVPSSLCVFYIQDRTTTELEARHAIGEGSATVRNMRIPVGQRLSGWVAANRQTIVNSDATLDLGDAARSRSVRLKSCLSTPLVSNDHLIGVLSLYSPEAVGFTENHRRIVESVATQIADALAGAAEPEASTHHDELAELPSYAHLERLLVRRPSLSKNESRPFALLIIQLLDFEHGIQPHGDRDAALRYVVRQARSCLRIADVLFRKSDNRLVALLNDADENTAEVIAERLRRSTITSTAKSMGGTQTTVAIRVTKVCFPRDGASLTELMATASGQGTLSSSDRNDGLVH